MNSLEIPFQFPSEGVGGDKSIREQIVAGTVAAVVVSGRSAERQVNDAAFLVDGDRHGPDIGTAAAFPAVPTPGVVPNFTRLGDSVEIPDLLPGAGVVGALVAGHTGGDFVLRVEIGLRRVHRRSRRR